METQGGEGEPECVALAELSLAAGSRNCPPRPGQHPGGKIQPAYTHPRFRQQDEGVTRPGADLHHRAVAVDPGRLDDPVPHVGVDQEVLAAVPPGP